MKRTYRVKWSRISEPEEELVCIGLDVRTAFARILQGIQASGPIIVWDIELETCGSSRHQSPDF